MLKDTHVTRGLTPFTRFGLVYLDKDELVNICKSSKSFDDMFRGVSSKMYDKLDFRDKAYYTWEAVMYTGEAVSFSKQRG